MLLELKNIEKSFKISRKERFIALSDVNLSFSKGEFVSIVGPSGSGKSTLLNLIAGLDFPTSGELIIGDKTSKKFKQKDWDLYRKNNIGFIFQNFNLIEHLTALENVEIVMNLIGLSYSKRRKRAIELLELVGLEKHMNHRPSELSGGQKQRVAVARALANDPDIILADEPTGALDQHTGTQIMELIKSIAKDKLIIMVTHNDELAQKYSSRIVKVRDGKIESDEIIDEKEKNDTKSSLKKKNKVMSFFEAFKLSIRNMGKKKGRVAITVLAGCIGIAGFTLITGLGNGANIYIDKQLNKFGTANVLVLSKNIEKTDDQGNKTVEGSKDKQELESVLNNETIKNKITDVREFMDLSSMTIKVNGQTSKEEEKHQGFMIYSLAKQEKLEFLKENVDGNIPTIGKNEILINQSVARKLLKDLDLGTTDLNQIIGKEITMTYSGYINQALVEFDKTFTVSGVANELDIGISNVYYNYEDVQTWLESCKIKKDQTLYKYITDNSVAYEFTVTDIANTKEVSDYINDKANGGVGKISIMGASSNETGLGAFNIAIVVKQIFAQLIMMAQAVISIFIIIALVVSSIMTSIVLYSSIVERKTEIGIIKAVGGRNKDVIRIFESEAILMGIFSGVVGIVISFLSAPLIEKVISKVLNLDLPGIITIPLSKIPFTEITFPFATIIVIIAFSALVSGIAGYLPSRKATKLNVIDALRDE